MLKTKVIVTDVSNLTDARYFAAWGVDIMAFNINENIEDGIKAAEVLAFKSWIEGPILALQIPESIDNDLLFELIGKTEIKMLIIKPDQQEAIRAAFPEVKIIEDHQTHLLYNSEKFGYIQNEAEINKLDLKEIDGISVRGGLEEKPGFKSFDNMDTIFESLEEF